MPPLSKRLSLMSSQQSGDRAHRQWKMIAMIADEFDDIARRRKELFDSGQINLAKLPKPTDAVRQEEGSMCHCGEATLTECRCFG